MTDRELLELAAKAAGIKASWGIVTKYGPDGEEVIELTDLFFIEGDAHCAVWNPLTDDGDALRLAVKLELDIENFTPSFVRVGFWATEDEAAYIEEFRLADPCAATRRAIVRAAAEIGRDPGATQPKTTTPAKAQESAETLVPRGGIEPPTP